jgi:hypothetical protein
MIFLIEYQRSEGRIVTFKVFEDSEQSSAETARLEIELELLHKGLDGDHEVVLLQAESEEALRRTHRRYFEALSELVNSNGTSH